MTRYAIVPCSASKRAHRARAGNLYTGPLFRSALLAARELEKLGHVDGVRVLSAKHGLVQLEDVLEPYNVRMGDDEQLSPLELGRQLDQLEGDPDVELVPLLPRDYAAALELGRRSCELECYIAPNPLRGSRGLLEQRARLRELRTGTRRLVLELEGFSPA